MATVCEIKLRDGSVCFVDEADVAIIGGRDLYPALFHRNKTYVWIGSPGPQTLLHRFLLGARRGQMVDHINGNGLDNRRENLRFCTGTQNNANRVARHKYKGIWFAGANRQKPWRMSIGRTVAGVRETKSEYFYTEIEAARAYDTAAKQFFGPFARLNFPDDQQITVPPEAKFFQEGTTVCGSITTEAGLSGAAK